MDRPVLLFDGHCRFCLAQVARLRRWTGERLDFVSFREPGVLERFPQLKAADCERAMQLVQPDGRVHAGVDAALAALALRPGLRPLAALGRLPGLHALLVAGYRVVADNRFLLGGRVEDCADESCRVHVAAAEPRGALTAPRALVRDLWLRVLGAVLLIAFLSLDRQLVPLYGEHGLLPAREYMTEVHKALDAEKLSARQRPTLFLWIEPTDAALLWVERAGALCGLLLLLGLWPRLALLGAWALYLSLVTVGRVFLSFQWDNLLLEATFLSLFVAPWGLRPRGAPPPRVAGVLLMLWLLFRLQAESGWAKWLGGDPHWRDLSAVATYYETAPLPTWLGWWVHQLPGWAQEASTVLTLVVEGLLPVLLFTTRRLRLVCACVLVGFQVFVAATGNYGIFNLLTVALCLWALDDGHLRAAAARLRLRVAPRPPAAPLRPWSAAALLAGALLLAVLAVTPFRIYWQEPDAEPPSALEHVESWVAPFRTLNLYRLFVSLTLVRREVEIEGSRDGSTWSPYVFAHKPGDPARAPDFVAPHQPRLDFQFWFLCLDGPPSAPWFNGLLVKLVSEPALMARLFESTPCGDEAPAFLRYSVWEYRFSSREERARTGDWWTRDMLGMSSALTADELTWRPGDPPPQRRSSSQEEKAEKPSAPR
jgi:lipase maturation factor 1